MVGHGLGECCGKGIYHAGCVEEDHDDNANGPYGTSVHSNQLWLLPPTTLAVMDVIIIRVKEVVAGASSSFHRVSFVLFSNLV
jgi:hypothetical protein